MEGSRQMTETPTYAGIDVAKDRLDVVLRPSGEYVEATNDERGIRSVVRRLRKENVALAVLEATGGLEQPAAAVATGSPGCVKTGTSICRARGRSDSSFPAQAISAMATTAARHDIRLMVNWPTNWSPAMSPAPVRTARTRPSARSNSITTLCVRPNGDSSAAGPDMSIRPS